jgi:glycosyltransferase involved in cell wall biosynthesis
MRPLFARATLCVVPLRSGSGTRLKILEAMAMGRCVVSTGIGAEGLAALPGRHFERADTTEEFVRLITGLLVEAPRRLALEEAGRSLVCGHYDWRQITSEALARIHDLPHLEASRTCESTAP